MKNYLVIWEIEISADSPESAALEAFRAQQDPDTIATVFEVQEENDDGTYGEREVIDVAIKRAANARKKAPCI